MKSTIFNRHFLPALHISSSCTPSSLGRCCFLCTGGLFQAPPLYTGPLSRDLQKLFSSVSLLCSHGYSVSSLWRRAWLRWIFVCFLVPGVPLPLISAPPPIYLSCLCCRGANGTPKARFSRHHQSVLYDNFSISSLLFLNIIETIHFL